MPIQDESKLYAEFHRKLINSNLICDNDNIIVKKIHPIKQYGQILYHHIITIENTNKKYLIRTVKEKDCSYSIMNSLSLLNIISGKELFPCALTPPFQIETHSYIVTTYLEGENLETQIKFLSNEELLVLSNEINEKLKLIHSITNDRYSNGIQTTNDSFVDIMCKKLSHQFHNPQNIFSKGIDVEKLLDKVRHILFQTHFSKPTLVHMDIKPANIIISPLKEVSLIDFELSRFADLDYEWTNLLIKSVHAYDERFKKYVLNPIIEKNFFSLEKAILVDKYKVYLLYLAINKYLYCCKSETTCPDAIINLINRLIRELV